MPVKYMSVPGLVMGLELMPTRLWNYMSVLTKYAWPWTPAAPPIFVGAFLVAAFTDCIHLLAVLLVYLVLVILTMSALVMAFLAAFCVWMLDAGARMLISLIKYGAANSKAK